MRQERDFKGIWIPKELWLTKELSLQEKVFLVEIDSLDNDDGCFASNKYFEKFFDLSKGRCSQIIKQLEEKRFITIEYNRQGREIVQRIIRVVNKLNRYLENDDKVFNKLNRGIKYSKYPYLENDEDNNTSINNTISNNTVNKEIYENVKNAFNKIDGLSKVKLLNDGRKKKLDTRLKEFNEETILLAIKNINNSSFLKGKNKQGWKITFDWLIDSSTNLIKVLEGNYDDKRENSQLDDLAELYQKYGQEERERKL